MAGAALLGRVMWRVGTVVALHDETAIARTVRLKVPDWPSHFAGQHVDVRLTASDGYSAVRSYSIASAPNSENRVELTIERLPEGEVSPYLTQEVAVGDRLEIRGPIGGWFVWRTCQTEPIQLIAGGSGIVPLMAMIRSRSVWRSTAPFRLLYSVREPSAVWYRDELHALSRSRLPCDRNLRVYASRSERLAATARSTRRLPDRKRNLARQPCRDFLCLRPHIVCRKLLSLLTTSGHEPDRIQDRAFWAHGRTAMNSHYDYLDGNAAAGELSSILAMDVTTAESRCGTAAQPNALLRSTFTCVAPVLWRGARPASTCFFVW